MSIFSHKNLLNAYLSCRKNKRTKLSALIFEEKLEENLIALLKDLQERKYVPGKSVCFVVTNPKPREVFAAEFRDRIVHHLLVAELEDYFERRFIHDSYACRCGKGTHRAVSRLNCFLKKKENKNARYLQMDLKSFFMSIDKEILFSLLVKGINGRNETEKEELEWLLRTVLFHNPTENYFINGDKKLFELIPKHKSLFGQRAGRGLPIGNYSSQFFANVYLNELDQYAKRNLKCLNYVRYVDDFIIISRDKDFLFDCRDKISHFVSDNLNITINQKKTIIQETDKGVDFLGYYIKPFSIHTRRKVFKRYKDKLYNIAIGKKISDFDYIRSMRDSYAGHFNFYGKISA